MTTPLMFRQGVMPDLSWKAILTSLSGLPIRSMRGIRLPLPKEPTSTGKEARLIKSLKKVWFSCNVLGIFTDVYSERTKNLLQDLTSASVSQAGARLWTIEYRDFTYGQRFALF